MILICNPLKDLFEKIANLIFKQNLLNFFTLQMLM